MINLTQVCFYIAFHFSVGSICFLGSWCDKLCDKYVIFFYKTLCWLNVNKNKIIILYRFYFVQYSFLLFFYYYYYLINITYVARVKTKYQDSILPNTSYASVPLNPDASISVPFLLHIRILGRKGWNGMLTLIV